MTIILVLASIDYFFFFIQLGLFLGIGMMRDF